MPNKHFLIVIALLVGGVLQSGTAPAWAQQIALDRPAGEPIAAEATASGQLPLVDKNGDWVFRRQVNEVTVMFTATHKGKFVADLQRNDVQVRDDKRPPAEIMDFRNEQGLPLRLGLLVDTSGSVNDHFKFETGAASQLVKEVVDNPKDQVFVAGFSHRMRIVQDFTNDSSQVSRALRKLHDDQGDTAVFDSVIKACKKLAEPADGQPAARVLVLLSDGDDNASSAALKDAAEIAQAAEVTIYTVSTNPHGLNLLGDEALQKLAEQSGGRGLFPGSQKQITKAFDRIRDELRNRYAVSYRPAEFKPDGHFRKIRIVARRFGKKLHVHARKGYYARPILADVIAASSGR